MPKRQKLSRRERKSSISPYQKYGKKPYKYPFPTGENSHEARRKHFEGK